MQPMSSKASWAISKNTNFNDRFNYLAKQQAEMSSYEREQGKKLVNSLQTLANVACKRAKQPTAANTIQAL